MKGAGNGEGKFVSIMDRKECESSKTKAGDPGTWHSFNFWFFPRNPLDAMIREICEEDDPDRMDRLLDIWEKIDGSVDVNTCTAKALKCPEIRTSFLEIEKTSPEDKKLLQDVDKTPSTANDSGEEESPGDVDLSSRLWEMGDTDDEIARMRKDITLRNAPAATWSAVNEDDEAKLNDLLTIIDINDRGTLCTAFNIRTGGLNHFLTRYLELTCK